MKKILTLLILITVFALPARAQSNEIYINQYKSSGMEKTENTLPDETKSILKDFGFTPENPSGINNITPKSAVKMISDFVKSKGKLPLKSGFCTLAVILLCAAFGMFCENSPINEAVNGVMNIIICLSIVAPVFSVITAVASAIKGTGVFMISFVPVYAGLTAAGGKAVTAAGFSTVLLFFSQLAVNIAGFVVVPVMSAYLALSISAGVSPLLSELNFAESLKKAALFGLGLVFTVFVGLISVQTTVNSAADGVSMRTLKFMVGTFVPVAGSALSEAAATVTASLNLLKSTAGIYAVAAVFILFLPMVIEIILWRVCLLFSRSAAGMFGLKKCADVCTAVDSTLSVLLGIIIFAAALFIISLSVIIKC